MFVGAGVLAFGTMCYWFFLKVQDSAAYKARPHAILDKARDTVAMYYLEKGRYPSSEEGLDALVAGGWLPSVPVDPWGRRLNYRYPSKRAGVQFEIWSYGADGKEGGSGEDQDIGNWNDSR